MIRDRDIGGGFVLRTFRMGAEQVFAGRELSRAEILAMPGANRQALIEKKFIGVYPPRPEPTVKDGGQVARYVIGVGGGKCDVVEGRRLNVEPLTPEEAAALAGIELHADPAPRPRRQRNRTPKARRQH